MEQELIAENSIQVNASPNKVWDVLTDPAAIKQYLFGTEAVSDWKVNSPITFKGEYNGKAYEDKGTILALEPGKLLRYSYWSSMGGKEDKPENYVNVTYQIIEQDGKVQLKLMQDGIKTEKELEHLNQNWQKVLEGIKKVTEG